jgi:hypothetical protein
MRRSLWKAVVARDAVSAWRQYDDPLFNGRIKPGLVAEFRTGVETWVQVLDQLGTRMNAGYVVDGAGFEPAIPVV